MWKRTDFRDFWGITRKPASIDVILVSFSLTLNRFHTLVWCFYCWLWASNCWLVNFWNHYISSKNADENYQKNSPIFHCDNSWNFLFENISENGQISRLTHKIPKKKIPDVLYVFLFNDPLPSNWETLNSF